MAISINNDKGNINIEDSVIASVAGMAAIECYGVVGMSSKSTAGGFFELLMKENITKGVKVGITENKVVLDLYVVLQYGVKISTVAENIISQVKYNVEKHTDVKVECINIHIQGIRVQK